MHPFTPRTQRVLRLANDIAQRSQMREGFDLAVLIAIVEEGGGIGAAILERLGLGLRSLYLRIPEPCAAADSRIETELEQLTAAAAGVMVERERKEIGTEHLLLTMTRLRDSIAGKVLADAGVTENQFHAAARALAHDENWWAKQA